jgi:hypothetical protein
MKVRGTNHSLSVLVIVFKSINGKLFELLRRPLPHTSPYKGLPYYTSLETCEIGGNPPKSPLERGTLKAPFPRGLGDLHLETKSMFLKGGFIGTTNDV